MKKKDTPALKWKKVKEHKLVEYDITYEWEGKQKTRRITFKDGRPYEYDGFIMSKELQYIKDLTEGSEL